MRVRAAMLLKQVDPAAAADADARIRPAPTTVPADLYTNSKIGGARLCQRRSTSIPTAARFRSSSRSTSAPLTSQNFITLALKGYFNGLSVHRVVPDFVMQDGDPRGDGEGGPGYTIRDELNERPYLRGTLGMALDPWPDTGGSQHFSITHSPQPAPRCELYMPVFGRCRGRHGRRGQDSAVGRHPADPRLGRRDGDWPWRVTSRDLGFGDRWRPSTQRSLRTQRIFSVLLCELCESPVFKRL